MVEVINDEIVSAQLNIHNVSAALEHESCRVTKLPVIVMIIVFDRLELMPRCFVKTTGCYMAEESR